MFVNRPPTISCLDIFMVEILNLLLIKRRTRQLSSDNSSNSSPEAKKRQECDHSDSPEGERKEKEMTFFPL